MEQEQGMAIPGNGDLGPGETARTTEANALTERAGPTWRGFVLAILAAVVLSVLATLMFGGSWSSYTLQPAGAGSSGGCAPCCPPPESGK